LKESLYMKKKIILFLVILAAALDARLNVVTTTTVIYDIVRQVGGEHVSVDYICRGDQDPHFLEILPSYMLKIRKADLMFQNGLGLELWAQKLIDGSRNADLKLVDLSNNISKKGIPTGKIDASQGDIHPFGNPHYWLDPENIRIMATDIMHELSLQDPDNRSYFQSNYDRFIAAIEQKMKTWHAQTVGIKDKQFIVYHDTWIYFAERFGFKVAGYVEPKPGIPPTPSHNAELIRLISNNDIPMIIMENYYSDSSPNQISEATGIKIVKVPIYVYGLENVHTYIDLMDEIISRITAGE